MISAEKIEELKKEYATHHGNGEKHLSTGGSRLDVSAYLTAYNIEHGVKANGSRVLFTLARCLFNQDHGPNESAIVQGADGKLYYQCFHDGCKGRTWRDARRIISGDASMRVFMEGGAKGDEGEVKIEDNLYTDSQLMPKVELPYWVFPEKFREHLLLKGEIYNVPPEIIVGASIAVLTAAIGNKFKVCVKSGYEAPLFCWVIVVFETGQGKSPAINSSLSPIYEIQHELEEDYQQQLKGHLSRLEERKRLKTRDPSGFGEDDPPKRRHIVTSDCTVEALAAIYSGDDHGLIIHRDELAGLILSQNQYKARGSGDDREKYLQLWDGGGFKVDRVKGTQIVKRSGASIIGGIQPRILPRIFGEESFHTGLFPRFIPIVPDPIERRFNEAALTEDMKLYWATIVRGCYEMPWSTDLKLLILSSEAKALWGNFYNEMCSLRPLLSERAKVFIPKLVHYSLKLIGFLHTLDHVTTNIGPMGAPFGGFGLPSGVIGPEAVARGISLTRYFMGQISKLLEKYGDTGKRVSGQIDRLITVLWDLQGEVKGGRLLVGRIRERYNDGLPEIAALATDHQVLTAMLRSLGIETKPGGHGGYSQVLWDQEKMEKIFRKGVTLATLLTKNDKNLGFHGGNGDEGDEGEAVDERNSINLTDAESIE
jgi:hypothetical protein